MESTRRALVRDAAAVGAMIVLALLGLMVTYDYLAADGELDTVPPVGWSIALTVVLLAPVMFRRRWPATVAVTVSLLFSVYRVVEVPEGAMSSLALFLAIYTAGAWGRTPVERRWSRGLAISVSTGVLVWAVFVDAEYVNVDAALATFFTVAINTAFFVAAWMMGDLARVGRENEAELSRRAGQLAVEREERARRAVTDERLRIARELHDVVAHHVSVMGVQAGAARRVLAADPDRAAEALAAIEESGRQAVGELQKLVGFLRSADETNGMAPQPTMDDLPRLLDQTRATGLPVELRTIGAPRPVTASVALSIYRIVQEGLTNALKHAGPVPTTVVLTYGLDSLDVEIVNARGTLRPSPGGGRGLLGMRERVAMLGGRFEAGATTDGGFRVAAGLPTMTPYEQAVTPA